MKTAVAAKATFRWRDAKQPKHRAPVAEVSKTAEQNGAACNALKDVSKEIDVACEATHCRFNENEKCHADHIGISGAGACTCGETECASFECNC